MTLDKIVLRPRKLCLTISETTNDFVGLTIVYVTGNVNVHNVKI